MFPENGFHYPLVIQQLTELWIKRSIYRWFTMIYIKVYLSKKDDVPVRYVKQLPESRGQLLQSIDHPVAWAHQSLHRLPCQGKRWRMFPAETADWLHCVHLNLCHLCHSPHKLWPYMAVKWGREGKSRPVHWGTTGYNWPSRRRNVNSVIEQQRPPASDEGAVASRGTGWKAPIHNSQISLSLSLSLAKIMLTWCCRITSRKLT